MPRFDEGHALLIGLANYQDPSLRLPVPVTVADAEEVTNALRDPATCAYRDGQVQLLRDGEATRAAVIDALNALATKKADDTVFIFFSGHGVLGEDGLYYLTTHDTILTSLNLARKDTGVSAPQFLDLLRNIKARRLLLLVNSCFSGHIAPTLAPGDALRAPISTTLGTQVLGAGEGRVLITASRPTQYSYYRQQDKHTFFGQALVDGLRGKGAPSSGGYVGLYELYQYLYTRVTNAVSALGGVQEPVLNIVKGVGPFPVALHSGGTLGALTPSAIQQGPPNGAVEVVVQAIGRGAQAFNFRLVTRICG